MTAGAIFGIAITMIYAKVIQKRNQVKRIL